MEREFAYRALHPSPPTVMGWNGCTRQCSMCIIRNPLGLPCSCFLAQRRWICICLHCCAAWISNHASQHTNSANFSWEMRKERCCYSPKCTCTSTDEMPCSVLTSPHLAAALFDTGRNAQSKHIGPATTSEFRSGASSDFTVVLSQVTSTSSEGR